MACPSSEPEGGYLQASPIWVLQAEMPDLFLTKSHFHHDVGEMSLICQNVADPKNMFFITAKLYQYLKFWSGMMLEKVRKYKKNCLWKDMDLTESSCTTIFSFKSEKQVRLSSAMQGKNFETTMKMKKIWIKFT